MRTIRAASCVLAAVIFACGQRVHSEEPHEEVLTEEPPEETFRKLCAKRISFISIGPDIAGIVETIKGATHLDIKMDPRISARKSAISLRLKDVSALQALTWATRLSGTAFKTENLSLIVTDGANVPENAGKGAEADSAAQTEIEAIKRKLKESIVTFEFYDAPLAEAINAICGFAEVPNVVIDPSVMKNAAQINLRVTKMEAGVALQWVLKLAELEYVVKDNAIFIAKPAQQ